MHGGEGGGREFRERNGARVAWECMSHVITGSHAAVLGNTAACEGQGKLSACFRGRLASGVCRGGPGLNTAPHHYAQARDVMLNAIFIVYNPQSVSFNNRFLFFKNFRYNIE